MIKTHDLFMAALKGILKDQWGLQIKLAKAAGLTPQKMNNMMAGDRKSDEDERRAIAAALGYDYDAFLDLGRRALGLPVAGKAEPAPSPEVAGYLDQARQIIEAGGEKAETLKNMIKIMKE